MPAGMTRQEEIILARQMDMFHKIHTFEGQAIKELTAQYKEMVKSLSAEIEIAYRLKPHRYWTNDRLVNLLAEAQMMVATLDATLVDNIASAIGDVGVYAYKGTNAIMSWDGKVNGFNNFALSKAQIIQLVTEQKMGGKTMSEWVGSTLSKDFDDIKSAIIQGQLKGYGYGKTLRQLTAALGLKQGDPAIRNLETVIKTYTQTMAVKAQQDVFETNKKFIPELEWSAIMENGNTSTGSGTCPRCMALDGRTWKTDNHNRPNCPLHGRCRCMLLPKELTWEELGIDGVAELEEDYKPWTIRAEETKDVMYWGGIKGNYADWWRTRSLKFQNNAIGPRRAELVRSGKVQFKNLVDDDGNLINIKDL